MMSTATFDSEYTLGRVIGTGTYSTVFECTHKDTRDTYAVKVIQKQKDVPQKQETDIVKEVSAMRLLDDVPNVVKLVAAFNETSTAYLVMEYMRGGEVLSLVNKNTRGVSEAVAAKMMGTLLSTVAAMHDLSLCHRDLKLENLLFVGEGEGEGMDEGDFKVADFGFASVVGPQGLRVSCGTPLYMAPEVHAARKLGGAPYTLSADVWSAGVIAFALLCGRPPYPLHFTPSIFSRPPVFPDHVSVEARSFVEEMLVCCPTDRVTARAALSHPWIAAVTTASAEQEASRTS